MQPICLPLQYFELKNGQLLFVTGWGKTEKGLFFNHKLLKIISTLLYFLGTTSFVKLKTTVFYLNKEECSNYIEYKTDNTQLCAGSSNRSDTCKGDSGGPLMALKLHQGEIKLYAVGIVSLGFRCGGKAAIYSNTSIFVDWILETMES